MGEDAPRVDVALEAIGHEQEMVAAAAAIIVGHGELQIKELQKIDGE